MKTKLLIGLLVVVIIACGVLLGMKFFIKNESSEDLAASDDPNSLMTVVLDDKEEPKSMYAGDERTIAVMIDNVGDAVPQTGLNDAMLVYEAYVEGSLTRFMAVYKKANVETIGPTRSARPCFIDYALENDSIFVHYGGSDRALADVEKLNMENENGILSPKGVFWRTSKKKAPHNALTGIKQIWDYANSKKYRTTTKERNVLNYVTDPVTLEDGRIANTVDIPYKSTKVKFVYNAETERYERYAGGKIAKDWLTGETLTTKNIIITFANNYTTDEENGYGRQEIENIGNLDGYYITNGRAIQIKCLKETRAGRTVYNDLDGNEIKVNDGNTYIQIVPPSMEITFGEE